MFSPPDSPLVLVVDYRESERRLIAKALLTADFRVAEAATGDEALAVFLQRQPQIVVLDLLMPFTGGLSACRLLRAQPGGQNLLILMFSGLQDAGTIRRVYDAGASDFLAKPSVASTLRDYAALTSRLLFLWRNWYLTASDRFD